MVLHGLFGSGDNWGAVSRHLIDDAVAIRIVAVDLRNHGKSPHHADMNYRVMADDVIETLGALNIHHCTMLGHSMGGKVAMELALSADRDRIGIDRLIVVDIAPRDHEPSHREILSALSAIDLTLLKRRSDADQQLAADIPDAAVRQFLLKNLVRDDPGHYRWRLNLRALSNHYDELTGAPAVQHRYDQPTLLLRGTQSDYVTTADLALFRQFFTHLVDHPVPGAGHWLHITHTSEVADAISTFLQR